MKEIRERFRSPKSCKNRYRGNDLTINLKQIANDYPMINYANM